MITNKTDVFEGNKATVGTPLVELLWGEIELGREIDNKHY